jgi:DNA-binding NtrC family response regulator
MPGLNGHMLARELKRRAPDLPIVLMTAYPSLARELPAASGSFEYMTKPLDGDRLESWLLRVVGEPPGEF